jgi:hypothetical protein
VSSVLLAELQKLVSAHGYWVVALIVGLESMGLPLPGETSPGDFGREGREFADGLRPDRTLPRPSCLARCSSCGGAALPRRYVSRWGERGASMSSSRQRAATVTRHAITLVAWYRCLRTSRGRGV